MSDSLRMLIGFYCLRLSDGNGTKVWPGNCLRIPEAGFFKSRKWGCPPGQGWPWEPSGFVGESSTLPSVTPTRCIAAL